MFTTAPGNNANDGKSPGQPMASLNALLTLYPQLHAGDTVYIDTGSYTLVRNVVLGLENSGVRIVGAGQRQVTPSLTSGVVLADNPVAYWRLGDTTGTTAVDASGHGFDGTYSAGVTRSVPGPSDDGAAGFHHQGQLVSVPDAPALNPAQLTVEAWVNYRGPTKDNYGSIVEKTNEDSSGGFSQGYSLRCIQGHPEFLLGYSSTYFVDAPLPEGQWVYLVGTFDGSTIKLYVDGALAYSAAATSRFNGNSAPLQIGAAAGQYGTWNGSIDEVAVYDKALTADQVLTRFQRAGWTGTLLDRGNTSAGSYVFDVAGAKNLALADMSIADASIGIRAADSANSTGLSVSNVDVGNCAAVGIDVGPSNDGARLDHNTVHGINVAPDVIATYDQYAVGIYNGGANAILEGNLVFGNDRYGITLTGPGLTVTHNVVSDNNTYGIHAFGSLVYDPSTGVYTAVNPLSRLLLDSNDVSRNPTGILVEAGYNPASGADHDVVSNNLVHDNYYNYGLSSAAVVGIRTMAGHGGKVFIVGNQIYHNAGKGVWLSNDCDAVNNVVFGNVDGVVELPQSDGFGGYVLTADLISGNRVYGNSGAGITSIDASEVTGNVLYSNAVGIRGGIPGDYLFPFKGQVDHNVVYANSEVGILLAGSSGGKVNDNTVYAPNGDAVRVSASSSNVSIRDNILSADNGYDLYVSNDSQKGFASDYNLFHTGPFGKIGFWQTDFTSLRDWQLNVGQDLHSVSADPRFINASGSNFHLAAGSPAVDAGDPALAYAAEPLPNGGRIDLGAYGNTPEATPSAAAGVLVEQSAGATNVAVGGANDAYTLVLTSPPTADVTITVQPDSHLSVLPSVLTFTAANWNLAQTVIVHALPDTAPEPPRTVSIIHAASSADAAYNGIAVPRVAVGITDSVIAMHPIAAAITSSNTATFLAGTAATFTVIASGSPTPTFSEMGALPSGVSFNSSSGALSGTPAAGTAGTYNLTFSAHNGVGSDATQSFTLTVTASAPPAPPAPTTTADTFVLGPNAPNSGSGPTNVLANDISNDNQPANLRATLISTTTNGKLSWNADGSFTYTPGPSFAGIDRFSYQASEGGTASNTVTDTLLSYNASLVDKLYHQVLHRSAEDGGLQFWTAKLDAGALLDVVAKGIFNSVERLDPLVTQFYQKYLLRGTDPGGLAFWVADWARNGGPDHVVVSILASKEFLDDAGDTNDGFVRLLYQRFLGRAAEQGGLSYWDGLLNSGQLTTPQVAAQFQTTHEQHVNLVDFLYGEYFNGAVPTTAQAQPYVADLDAGKNETQIEIEIIDSTDYRNAPPKPAAGTVGDALFPH